MILEIYILDAKTNTGQSVNTVWHAYYILDQQGKSKIVKKVRNCIQDYLEELADDYLEVQPENANILSTQIEFRKDIKNEILFYNQKYRGLLHVECKDPNKFIIRIHYYKQKRL